jgi:uncharacterized membrane protein YgcG
VEEVERAAARGAAETAGEEAERRVLDIEEADIQRALEALAAAAGKNGGGERCAREGGGGATRGGGGESGGGGRSILKH